MKQNTDFLQSANKEVLVILQQSTLRPKSVFPDITRVCLGWRSRYSNPDKGKKGFSSPKHSDHLLYPTSLIFSGYQLGREVDQLP
jgi:hypothetical protein